MKTKRMKSKDRFLGVLNMPEATEVGFPLRRILRTLVAIQVDVVKRLKLNKRRKRLPIIYHKITANKTYSTINLQMRVEFGIGENFSLLFLKVENPLNRLVILAKYGSMMLAGDCHFAQVLSSQMS